MADYNLGPFRIRPKGEYSSTESYRFLDLVTYNGGSYININYDTIDGTACIGILPEGQAQSELYWQCIAHKGDKGDKGEGYDGFLKVTNGSWDYSKSDKIFIPTGSATILNITNVYNGCCGVVITTEQLGLPTNSDKSIDYNYITIGANQYFLYTFIYSKSPLTSEDKFIWNRTVIMQ